MIYHQEGGGGGGGGGGGLASLREHAFGYTCVYVRYVRPYTESFNLSTFVFVCSIEIFGIWPYISDIHTRIAMQFR